MGLVNIDKYDHDSKYYYSSRPCKRGHKSKRYIVDRSCFDCKKIQAENWAKHNIDKAREANRNFRRRCRKDPLYRLYASVSLGIWYWLKKDKAGKRWESLVTFTKDELKQHLENQFDENMTWDNYGSYWHVDHIKPKSKCSTFKEAWSLSNLQPLEAKKNLAKKNTYEEELVKGLKGIS